MINFDLIKKQLIFKSKEFPDCAYQCCETIGKGGMGMVYLAKLRKLPSSPTTEPVNQQNQTLLRTNSIRASHAYPMVT